MATKKTSKTVRIDGPYDAAFGSRRGRGHTAMNGNYYVNEITLQSQYIHNGFARIICDVPAEEMTRAGFTIEGDSVTPEMQKQIQSKLEELNAAKHLNEAIKWRRAFGGGMIVLGLNDGNLLDQELDETTLDEIEFMRVYDRFECIVEKRYDDPSNKKYGEVEIWKIQPRTNMSPYLVHETRVLIFDGESVPNYARYSNDGWGASTIQSCLVQLKRLDTAYKFANLLLERMQQAVHGIPGLSEQIETKEGENLVASRVDVVDRVRGALNTIVIDSLETYEIKSLSLTGAQEILDRDAEALAATSRVPVYVLMTRSPGGLNSTNASGQDAWHSQVASWQNDQMRQPCDRLVSLIRLTDSNGETDGGDYTLKFNPLSTPGDLEQADIDLKNNQAKKTLVEALTAAAAGGAIDEDEMRELLPEDWELTGPAPEPVEEPPSPMVLNPGQTIVDPTPGNSNPVPVGSK